jgi:hypothetical protein
VPVVRDFVPIEEDFQRAGTVLVGDFGSWLTEPAREALDGTDEVALEFGAARLIERCVVVPVRWAADAGPFATLEADLRLEPMPSMRSHLSLSGTYVASSSEASRHDAVTEHHLTESRVRRFLVKVAATLERRRTEN